MALQQNPSQRSGLMRHIPLDPILRECPLPRLQEQVDQHLTSHPTGPPDGNLRCSIPDLPVKTEHFLQRFLCSSLVSKKLDITRRALDVGTSSGDGFPTSWRFKIMERGLERQQRQEMSTQKGALRLCSSLNVFQSAEQQAWALLFRMLV